MSYLVERTKLHLLHLFMYICRIFPVDKSKIVIMSYYGKGFADNGRSIALELLKEDPKLDIVWAARKEARGSIPDGIRYVEYCSLRYYWELATAGIWIDNCRKGREILKRKDQYYIQTWHGMVALKRIEKDAQDSLNPGYIDSAKQDSKMADVILSGCGFFTKLCRKAFWYDGEILESGSPRLDVLFHQTEESMCAVRKKLGIPDGKKVVLYAPTFRADGSTDCYIRDYGQILAALEEKTGDEWVFAVRLHPNVASKTNFITYSDKLINATAYPDLYDIIPISDVVISDYSSLMFDAGLIHKPVLLYATDIDAYTADRNFYFDITQLPFPLACDCAQLMRNIQTFDNDAYQAALDKFNASVDYYENGTASETVVKRILEVLGK